MGHDVLFLCVCFAVPSTVGSLLLDDVVRDGESIQSPLMKIWGWFAFSQETSTSGINSSLIPMKKHCPCHESSSLIFTKWVVDVILLQVGLKCSSMQMKVNVYFLVLCEQTDGLSTFNKSLRSYLRLRFRLRLCLYVNVQIDTGTQLSKSLPVLSLVLSQPNNTFFRFPEHANRIVALSKKVSLFWQLDFCFLVGSLVEQLLNPFPSSNYLYKKSLEEVEVTHVLSRKWILQFPS